MEYFIDCRILFINWMLIQKNINNKDNNKNISNCIWTSLYSVLTAPLLLNPRTNIRPILMLNYLDYSKKS